MNRPSTTEGLPELWDTEHSQLIVEDGNHRIFQAYLDGDRTFDAMVSSETIITFMVEYMRRGAV